MSSALIVDATTKMTKEKWPNFIRKRCPSVLKRPKKVNTVAVQLNARMLTVSHTEVKKAPLP